MPTLYRPHKGFDGLTPEIDPSRCRAQTYERVSRNFSQCARKVAVERDGVGYCRQHDPEAEKAREAERQRKYAAEQERRDRSWKRPLDYRDTLRTIAAGHNDARTLAQEALERWNDIAEEPTP